MAQANMSVAVKIENKIFRFIENLAANNFKVNFTIECTYLVNYFKGNFVFAVFRGRRLVINDVEH